MLVKLRRNWFDPLGFQHEVSRGAVIQVPDEWEPILPRDAEILSRDATLELPSEGLEPKPGFQAKDERAQRLDLIPSAGDTRTTNVPAGLVNDRARAANQGRDGGESGSDAPTLAERIAGEGEDLDPALHREVEPTRPDAPEDDRKATEEGIRAAEKAQAEQKPDASKETSSKKPGSRL